MFSTTITGASGSISRNAAAPSRWLIRKPCFRFASCFGSSTGEYPSFFSALATWSSVCSCSGHPATHAGGRASPFDTRYTVFFAMTSHS